MKFIEAYKDENGFHYVVEFKDGSQRPFNYGPAPGTICVGVIERQAIGANGQPAFEPLFDDSGNVQLTIRVDDKDNPILDANKNPILDPVTVPVIVKEPKFEKESEADYRARIEQEIIETCKQLEAIQNQPAPEPEQFDELKGREF